MPAVTRTLHVLVLGLWFGSVVFFTLAGVLLFQAFADKTRLPGNGRDWWLPMPPELGREPPSPRFPDPLRLEQGSRLAGVAVGAIFPWYYGIQTGCAVAALLTAIVLRTRGRLSNVRLIVLALGLLFVLIGWGLERYVEGLREPRNTALDEVLSTDKPTPELIRTAEEARAAFGMWHGISLLDNFTVLALAGVGLALAAHLPGRAEQGGSP
jgi:hypothetical protein